MTYASARAPGLSKIRTLWMSSFTPTVTGLAACQETQRWMLSKGDWRFSPKSLFPALSYGVATMALTAPLKP